MMTIDDSGMFHLNALSKTIIESLFTKRNLRTVGLSPGSGWNAAGGGGSGEGGRADVGTSLRPPPEEVERIGMKIGFSAVGGTVPLAPSRSGRLTPTIFVQNRLVSLQPLTDREPTNVNVPKHRRSSSKPMSVRLRRCSLCYRCESVPKPTAQVLVRIAIGRFVAFRCHIQKHLRRQWTKFLCIFFRVARGQ